MSSWTDERVDRLKAMHKEGLTASEMATRLGGITRNAVIGKCCRLGLGPIGGGRASDPMKTRLQRAAERADRPARPPRRAAPPPVISVQAAVFGAEKVRPITAAQPRARHVDDTPGTATLLTLGAHMCKWPIGDPVLENFTLCGRRQEEGKPPYCFEHNQVAYQPEKAGKKRTANELARSLRRYL